MSIRDHVDLKRAAQIYVVANTPTYLVRRFKAELSLRGLLIKMGPQAVLAEFNAAVAAEPSNIQDLVTPYVALATLSLSEDLSFLKAVPRQLPVLTYKWLDEIRDYLIETYDPIKFYSIQAPPQTAPEPLFSSSSASTTTSYQA
jgi:hypothetical protein